MQVPTFRAQPLTPACDAWCEFPVSDRPNAVRQFFDAAAQQPSLIKVSRLVKLAVTIALNNSKDHDSRFASYGWVDTY